MVRLAIPDDVITMFVVGYPDPVTETMRAVIPDGKDDNINESSIWWNPVLAELSPGDAQSWCSSSWWYALTWLM